MGGSSGPDYGQLAVQQGDVNEEVNLAQTYANRPSQYTPWGYTSWTNQQVIDPSTGKPVTQWSQTQGLTPELQDILNKQIAIEGGRTDIAGMLTGRMMGEFGAPVDWSGLAPMGQVPVNQYTVPEGSVGDPNAFRERGEEAAYQSMMSRIEPQYEEQRRAAEVAMRNQGLGPEDAAWKAQMQSIGQGETDARAQAMYAASEQGRMESALNWGQQLQNNQNVFNQSLSANQQNYGQGMSSAQFANQIRQQQIAEEMQMRGYSLNEINALLSGSQVAPPQMPSFAQAGAAQPAPIYQAGVSQGNADAASDPTAGLINAAATVGGGLLSNTSLF